jgi:hypothetical protein
MDLKDTRGDTALNVRVELDNPPAVITRPGRSERVSLDWDRALDDEGHLRHCPVCGCSELFAKKQFPQVTGFALLIVAAILALVLFGVGRVELAVMALVAVVIIDAIIYFFVPRELTCYLCRTDFRGVKIRKGHPRWDSDLDEQYKPMRRPGVRPGIVGPQEPPQ